MSIDPGKLDRGGLDPSELEDGEYTGLRLTADEFLALGETRHRYELVDGVVVMTAGPALPGVSPRHSEVAMRIAQQLLDFCDRTGAARVFAGTDIRFSDAIVYRPEIAVYRSGRIPGEVNRLDSPPDLIVEVAPSATKGLDLITKRDDYDRFGIAEYWAIDPNTAELRCWRRQGSRLCEVPIESDTAASSAIDGFELDLKPIRRIAGI